MFRSVLLAALVLPANCVLTLAQEVPISTLPAANYSMVERLPPIEADAATSIEPTAGAADDAPPEVEPLEVDAVFLNPSAAFRRKTWEGSVELGLDGSEGNSRTFNFQFGVDAKRKTEKDVISVDLDYRKKTADYNETANRAFLDWRYEYLFDECPWTTFVHGTVDYDEFQVFDTRVTIDAGLGYQWIDNECTTFVTRCGGGASHEIGGPDESVVPELGFGLDYEHKFSDRQKISMTVDYTPDVTNFDDYRLKSRASWELLIDQATNLSLKLSVLNRYDSTPNGSKPNDLDYSAVLLWKF